MDRRRIIGIVIEISSKKQSLKSGDANFENRWLDRDDGHITYCIVLPKGRVYDNIIGLKFQIEAREKEEFNQYEIENVFYLPWEQILEVRTLDGRVIYRNWHLCPKCRRITKLFLKKKGPFCRYCALPISREKNREICISPLEEIKTG